MTVRDGIIFDISKKSAPTVRDVLELDDPAAYVRLEKGEPIGTRIFGPVTRELRLKGQTKIISLAPEVL